MRKNSLVWLGLIAGCAVAIGLVAHADSTNPLLSRIIAPFGLLGFILGNPHQGSVAVSVSAIFIVFSGGGACVGLLCQLALSYSRRRRAD